MDQINKLKAFSHRWENNPNQSDANQESYYSMREWQESAFETLKDSSRMIINAPMGSGKSWMMCLLSTYKMKQDPLLKTLIAVPQTIIASGFLKEKIQMPNGEKIDWQIKHNLCDVDTVATVRYVIQWLKGANDSFEDRTLICTHATLTHVYKKLKEMQLLGLLNNLLVWIDEAHHVKNVRAEDLDVVINNELGGLVGYLSHAQDVNVQLGLVTASFFRGDRYSVLTSEMESKFTRFKLPYDEYFKTMKHLKSFSIDFLLCGANYNNAIELLIQQRRAKDIIYIPHPTSQYSSKDKYKEVRNIIAGYEKTYSQGIQNVDENCLMLSGHDDSFKILDLVDESNRSKKKTFISQPKAKHDLDAIIALGMFKEGANWIWADRSMIVGHRASLVDMLQMIGRLFRDAPEKEHVEVFQLLTFSFDQQDEDSFKENLNNYLKAIFASLLLEDILKPVKIKIQQEKNSNEISSTQKSEQSVTNLLSVIVPDEMKQQEIRENIINHWVEIKAQNKETSTDITQLRNHYDILIPRMLEVKYGITEHASEIATEEWNRLARRSLSLRGIAVEDITIDILKFTDPLDCLMRYTSGVCDITTFEQFRLAMQVSQKQWKPFEVAREYARSKNLKTYKQWLKLSKQKDFPSDIPKAPDQVYKNCGWISWGDYLGSDNLKNKPWLPFSEARTRIRGLGLKSLTEFNKYMNNKMPHLPSYKHQIPKTPYIVYADEWISWGDWLGTNRIASQNYQYCTFEKSREFARSKKLKNNKEWRNETKKIDFSKDIPKNPDRTYKNNGWITWADFLGTSNFKNNLWLPFEQSREFIRALSVTTEAEYRKYIKGKRPDLPPLPQNIPKAPWSVYKKQWINMKDWLGIK